MKGPVTAGETSITDVASYGDIGFNPMCGAAVQVDAQPPDDSESAKANMAHF